MKYTNNLQHCLYPNYMNMFENTQISKKMNYHLVENGKWNLKIISQRNVQIVKKTQIVIVPYYLSKTIQNNTNTIYTLEWLRERWSISCVRDILKQWNSYIHCVWVCKFVQPLRKTARIYWSWIKYFLMTQQFHFRWLYPYLIWNHIF